VTKSVLAFSVAALCLATTSQAALAARAQDQTPNTAARKVTVHTPVVVYRAGTNTLIPSSSPARVQGVMFRQNAGAMPSGRLASGWKVVTPVRGAYAQRQAALQCVPFARAKSGIEIVGNAVNWWDAAAGVYDRGNQPEPGAVLNFRANGNMRLGHVAVVSRVVNSREIEIDHANWSYAERGNIARNVAVIDVSERNDWTAVRVELARSGDYGAVYPTYGFIYGRPDREASASAARQSQAQRAYEEVAEAPDRSLR
jgi:surface antigen